jgi:hypothetical protein
LLVFVEAAHQLTKSVRDTSSHDRLDGLDQFGLKRQPLVSRNADAVELPQDRVILPVEGA